MLNLYLCTWKMCQKIVIVIVTLFRKAMNSEVKVVWFAGCNLNTKFVNSKNVC